MVDGEIHSVGVKGRVSVNDSDSYIDLAVQGFGLIQCPYYMAAKHLESGALREVLTEWLPAPMPISVVYLQNRHLSPKVRVFVDWVAELFASCPLLSGCSMSWDSNVNLPAPKKIIMNIPFGHWLKMKIWQKPIHSKLI